MDYTQLKLNQIAEKYGIPESELNLQAVTQQAVDAEQACHTLSPETSAFKRFKRRLLDFETMARYLRMLSPFSTGH